MDKSFISRKILSDITVHSKYAKYLPKEKRRETWEETVTRNEKMHAKKFPALKGEIEEAFSFVKDKKVLPSMRSLQFGGKPVEISPNRLYNCFAEDTEFITNNGLKSFKDFNDNDKVVVQGHVGRWNRATVRNYGKNKLNRVILRRGRSEKVFYVTPNHRWIKFDGSETTNLVIGDVLHPTNTEKQTTFDYDAADPMHKLYWCYGFVFGDGTVTNTSSGKYSLVRLCGDDIKYLPRFKEMGFSSSETNTCDGDIFVYTGKYKKTAPDINKEPLTMIKAFLDGYLCADGYKNPDWYRNPELSKYKSIQSSQKDHIEFLKSALEMCGYYITNIQDLTGQETNFGVRPETYSFAITNKIGSRPNTSWTVHSIEETDRLEDVWCLEVEQDHSFILSGGIVTGNCSYLPVDDIAAFSEAMFLLLGGSGVGYSVQKHHVDCLPEIIGPKNRQRRHLIGDSIEGWSDAVKVLVEAFFLGKSDPVFDFRDIRPKGTLLKTSGGRAPGPQPLKDCLHNIRKVFDSAKEARGIGTKLTTLEVHDIMCYIADAVLAGGIRRAALISLFSFDDDSMLTCKYGNWWELNPQRARANNSAVVLRHKIREKTFKEFWGKVEASRSGEPGIYFSNDKDYGANPSLRRGTRVLTTNGIFPIEELQDKEFEVKNLHGEISKARCWLSGRNKPLYRVTLSTGKEYYATAEHEWPIKYRNSWVKVKTSEIIAGDRLPILREDSLFIPASDINLGTRTEGFFIGWHLGDGWTTIRKDTGEEQNGLVVSKGDGDTIKNTLETFLHIRFELACSFSDRGSTYELNSVSRKWSAFKELFGYSTKDRGLPSSTWTNSEDFRKGLIDGLFSSNGSVERDSKRIRFHSSHKKLIEDVSDLLGFYGIKTTIYTKSTKLNDKIFDGYVLNISDRYSIQHFMKLFKLSHKAKQERLENYSFRYNSIEDKSVEVTSVELTNLKEDVWDISVYDSTHCFQIAHCITGNCVEIALKACQFCNLTTVNVSDVESQDDLNTRVRMASRLGTYQCSYTDFHYLRDIWQTNCEKEPLLGISMTGIASGRVLEYDLEEAARVAVEENRRVAEQLGIKPAKRVTCVKPEGTASLVVGCSSGIHAWHWKHYIRRLRVNKEEHVYKYLKRAIPDLIEDDVLKPETDAVISIPIAAPQGAILRDEGALELLERGKRLYEHWVKPGHVDGQNTHNVSITVSVKDDEWEKVGNWMWENRDYYNGIAVLPYDGGTYVQAPFEDISQKTYEEMLDKVRNIDLTKVVETEDNTKAKEELACAGGVCTITRL